MNRIFAVFENGQSPGELTRLCLDFLSEQKKAWPDLRQGYEMLKQMREREIVCGGFSVHLQYNPGRIVSSLASVEKKAVSVRPCFLCQNNLPEKQREIILEKDYLILCNPAPVLSSHLTICHREHRPQSLLENVGSFLRLIEAFGSSWTILYNGPRCGASAPDHLHFQAVKRGSMPIEEDIFKKDRVDTIREVDDVQVSRAKGLGREILILDGEHRKALTRELKNILLALKRVLPSEKEAMINVLGLRSEGKTRLLVFPRRKHRPEAFFKEGGDRIIVSPGAVEMGGIFVTPVERDFDRLDAPAVKGILNEVCLEGEVMDAVTEALARCDGSSESSGGW